MEQPIYFWVGVAASAFNGVAQSFGEAVFLGFLKGFPREMVAYVSVGTGFSGIFSTGTLLASRAIKLPFEIMFMLEIPTVLIYYMAFKWLENQKMKCHYIPPEDSKGERKQSTLEPLINESPPSQPEEDTYDDRHNVTLGCKTTSIILQKAFRIMFYLHSVYFFEYVAITCFADVMSQKLKLLYPSQIDLL